MQKRDSEIEIDLFGLSSYLLNLFNSWIDGFLSPTTLSYVVPQGSSQKPSLFFLYFFSVGSVFLKFLVALVIFMLMAVKFTKKDLIIKILFILSW